MNNKRKIISGIAGLAAVLGVGTAVYLSNKHEERKDRYQEKPAAIETEHWTAKEIDIPNEHRNFVNPENLIGWTNSQLAYSHEGELYVSGNPSPIATVNGKIEDALRPDSNGKVYVSYLSPDGLNNIVRMKKDNGRYALEGIVLKHNPKPGKIETDKTQWTFGGLAYQLVGYSPDGRGVIYVDRDSRLDTLTEYERKQKVLDSNFVSDVVNNRVYGLVKLDKDNQTVGDVEWYKELPKGVTTYELLPNEKRQSLEKELGGAPYFAHHSLYPNELIDGSIPVRIGRQFYNASEKNK